MNRRTFLQRAAAALGVLAIDPEQLLWTPGAKTIFLPPPRPLGVLTSIDDITQEALRALTLALKRPMPPIARVRGRSGWSRVPPKRVAPVFTTDYGSKINDNLQHQLTVSTDLQDVRYDTHLEPAMEAIADLMRETGCGPVGLLERPQGLGFGSAIATDPIAGLSVRGIVTPFDWEGPAPGVRFDIIYGT